MTGHGCSSRCGFCGACSVESDYYGHDEDRPVFCGTCNKELFPGTYRLTMAFGTFCSERCADAEEKKFQARLRHRRSA